MRPNDFYRETEYSVFRCAGPVLTKEDPWSTMGLPSEGVLEELIRSGLCGRGGAGFPLGIKWKSVRGEQNPVKYVICNSAEGEPGTAANRIIWETVPEKVICGMAICATLIGAKKAYIYLRKAYMDLAPMLQNLISENQHRFPDLNIEIFMETGGYVCGEETALMETIEGNRGEPRLKPPYPTAEGLFGCPTVLNNVESFANVPVVLLHGAEAFRAAGTEKMPGTKLYTLSGPVACPGVYELPVGITIRELYTRCGGLKNGTLKGMQVGGASGNFLKADMLDSSFAPGAPGISFGVGDVRFIAQEESAVEIARALMNFFAEESCGMCIPCKYGLEEVCKLLKQPQLDPKALEEMASFISQSARCAMGQAASGCMLSILRTFADEFTAYSEGGTGCEC